MASSNIADLTTTASPALQNWDAEWAAAENGKSYWDDYLSQITAEYNKELEDIELALQAPQTKYDAESADINLDLEAPQIKYDAAISNINLDLQNDLDRLRKNYDEAKANYDTIKIDYDNETYAEAAKNKYDSAIADINLDLQNDLDRLRKNYDEAKANYDLVRNDPNASESDISMAQEVKMWADMDLSEGGWYYQYEADQEKQQAQATYDSEKEAARSSAENNLSMAQEVKMWADMDLSEGGWYYQYEADQEKQQAQATYDSEKAAAELAASEQTTIAEATYSQEVAVAKALVEQQEADALDEYNQELAKAESARDTARSEFNSNQQAAAAEEAAKLAAEEAAAAEAAAIAAADQAAAEAAAIAAADQAAAEAANQDSTDSTNTATTSESDNGSTDQANATTTVLDTDINLNQRHTDFSGGDLLQLGYALKGNDNTGNPGGDASTPGVDGSGLTNVAVLGPNTADNNTYTLEISAASLDNDWDLESADIVLQYDTKLFETIDTDDITLGNHLTLEKGIVVDDDNGLIRIAAASLSNNAFNNGDSIGSEAIFASINVDFDESYFKSSDRTPDANGKFTFEGNPLGFELSANSDETVFSRTFNSDADGSENEDGAFTNRQIQSLGDLKGDTTFDEGDVNLYQAEIKFEEQTGGLTFGTERVIGANQGFTNLIRRNDTVTAETTIENIGNSLAKDIVIDDAGQVENANFIASRFLKKFSVDDEQSIADGEKVNLSGGVFHNDFLFHDDFSYNADGQESLNIEVDMKVTGQAGSVVDVTKGLFKVSAAGMTQNPETEATPDFFVSSAGSKNLITFQGDLNYDGRVSMKDLAFLNAGAARQQLVDSTVDDGNLIQVASDDSYARDVDADFSGKIDLADLSILDQDWGQSLHDGTSGGFTGSSDTFTMGHLDAQGDETWDNDSFVAQNAIEAEDAYIGSLEGPGTSGVIGSEGNEDGDNSLEGDNFQDPLVG